MHKRSILETHSKTNKTLRPLFLGFWAPPVIRPQAMLLEKMIPEWIRQGATPILVSFESDGEWDINAPRHLIPRFKAEGIWRMPYFNFFAQYLYWRKIAAELADLAKKENINVIYSFANPIESNIIGAMVARRTGVPYVAHFSDPWESGLRTYSKLGLWKILLLEKFVIKTATFVTATDEPMKSHIMRKYPLVLQKKFSVINHCYDPADYPPHVKRPADLADKFIISHIGSFYATKRLPDPLFAGVASLLKAHPELRSQIVVELVGGVNDYGGYGDRELHDAIVRYALDGVVRVMPPVSYKESLAKMKMADCLVVIEFAVSYFVAMKVFDYAGAERPIVALAPHGSSTSDIVTKLGYQSFAYEESRLLGEYFYDLIMKRIVPMPDVVYRQRFHVNTTTRALLDLLRKAISKKSHYSVN